MALAVGLGSWNISTYAITPGDATPVAPLVKISGLATDSHRDRIMLTDVYLQNLTALGWILMHLQSHVQFVTLGQLLEPGVPADELAAQGYLQMSDSKQAAEVAALRALGWELPAHNTGALVTAVSAPSPARAAHLHVADEIVSANGSTVHSSCDLVKVVHDLAPGSVLHLGVARAAISSNGAITWRAPRALTLRTEAAPRTEGSSGCPGEEGVSRSWIGVALEDGIHYQLPGTFRIDTANIGGPSAGLAMTLTLIDELSRGSLSGHHVIAATGTIDPSGQVGDVGGVAEKTVAVERAGATYFFVPVAEVAAAKSTAGPGLTILGVTTLTQVLSDLRRLGGDAPVPLSTPQ